jgi:lipoprotein NlpD
MTSELKTNGAAPRRRSARSMAALAVAAMLGGCTVMSTREAPVADRSTAPAAKPAEPAPASAPLKPAAPRVPAADGTYVVQAGDTLFSIAAAFGREVKDLVRWNGIDEPSRLRVGQTLRVVPPAGEAVAVLPVTPTAPAVTKPLDGPAVPPPATGDPSATPGPLASVPESRPAPPAATADWIWPVSGKVTDRFDEKRNKGIGIAAKEGDPVVASADGQVVYSGSGLRGYGNLVILKHNDDFISAYAHNRQILVKQGQMVKRGQRIAEVGKSDATQPKLHFEIRRQGKPVDPLAYLPPR